jgi:mitochondrial GTPase 1
MLGIRPLSTVAHPNPQGGRQPPSPMQTASPEQDEIQPQQTEGFIPRTTFYPPDGIPNSYFLGHHVSTLRKISTQLSNPHINFVIEVRDARIPLTSTSYLLDRAIGSTERVVVYTHSLFCPANTRQKLKTMQASPTSEVVFWDKERTRGGGSGTLMQSIAAAAARRDSLVGTTALIVGMPNVGKSSLLNYLRIVSSLENGTGRPAKKVAQVRSQAGTTRSVSTPVRILGRAGESEGTFYVLDTPGVSFPYVGNPESMLKMAVTGSIKEGLVGPDITVDYLLYHMNRYDPGVYKEFCEPTNDVTRFIEGAGRRLGYLEKGGVVNLANTAAAILSRWRTGLLGRFILDDVTDEAFELRKREWAEPAQSMTQLRKEWKASRSAASRKSRGGIIDA